MTNAQHTAIVGLRHEALSPAAERQADMLLGEPSSAAVRLLALASASSLQARSNLHGLQNTLALTPEDLAPAFPYAPAVRSALRNWLKASAEHPQLALRLLYTRAVVLPPELAVATLRPLAVRGVLPAIAAACTGPSARWIIATDSKLHKRTLYLRAAPSFTAQKATSPAESTLVERKLTAYLAAPLLRARREGPQKLADILEAIVPVGNLLERLCVEDLSELAQLIPARLLAQAILYPAYRPVFFIRPDRLLSLCRQQAATPEKTSWLPLLAGSWVRMSSDARKKFLHLLLNEQEKSCSQRHQLLVLRQLRTAWRMPDTLAHNLLDRLLPLQTSALSDEVAFLLVHLPANAYHHQLRQPQTVSVGASLEQALRLLTLRDQLDKQLNR